MPTRFVTFMVERTARRTAACLVPAALAAFLAACSGTPRTPAPITDRTVGVTPAISPGAARAAQGGAGSYTVKKGDTLYSIALDKGRDWHDLAAWNNLGDGTALTVGQTLRLGPPEGVPYAGSAGDSQGVQTHAIAGGGRVESRPLEGATPLPPPALPVATPASGPTPAPAPGPAPAPVSSDGVNWVWPGSGVVVAKFDGNTNKGLDLAGKLGDPVLAAAPGKVAYAGTGLRGYGNLIIVKHNATFLSAYAHNSKLLVKEGDDVKAGQKIAEVGASDADRPLLHFEIRKDGQPVDPSAYLPSR